MEQLVIIIHVLVCVFLVVLVLLQQGKGATMGASFGSGASTTVFGSQGSGGFLLKLTGIFAALFFITSLVLGYFAVRQAQASYVLPPVAPVVVPVSEASTLATTHEIMKETKTRLPAPVGSQ